GPGASVLADAVDHLLRGAHHDAGADEVDEAAEHEPQVLLLPPRGPRVGAEREPDVHRADDRARVASLPLAPAVEGRVARGVDLGRDEGDVPAVGVPRDDAEQPPLALPADPEPQPGLERPRIAERVVEVDLSPVQRDALAVEEPPQRRRALLELVEAVGDREQRQPEGLELDRVPADPEP